MGKVAIVTGGASGIGEAIVKGFAGESARVVIADLNADGGARVVKEVEATGQQAMFVRTDVSSLDDHRNVIEQAVRNFGKIDILVNDAAFSTREGALDVTLDNWRKVLEVDVTGLYFLSQAFAKQLIAQGTGGKIINIASVAGVSVFRPVSPAYHAAKAAVIQITRYLGVELAKHRINVNCIGPGTTLTPMSASQTEEYRRYLTKGIPMDRLANPEDMVGAAVFFASDESNYVTGQTIFVEGGALGIYVGRPEWPPPE